MKETYKIIRFLMKRPLEQQVEKYLSEGWELVGQPFIHKVEYNQAIQKRTNPKGKK